MANTDEKIIPSKIAHIVFQTKQYETMVDWYKRVFQTEIAYQNEELSFQTYDDEHHRFVIMRMPEEAPDRNPHSPGMAHLAYTLSNLNDLIATYERLKADDIMPTWLINHGVTTSVYYTDPDANMLEFQVDNFPTAEECQAFFRSEEFLNNQVGNAYSIEVLSQRLKAGIDISEAMPAALAAGDPNMMPGV